MSEEKKVKTARDLVQKAMVAAAAAVKPEDPEDHELAMKYPNLSAFLCTALPDEAGEQRYPRLVIAYDKITTTWSAELQVLAKEVKCVVHNDAFMGLLKCLDTALGLARPPWQALPHWTTNGRKKRR